MTECPSPNPTVQKQRPPILSPVSPFPLGSNDDQLEGAQARAAARAAAIRRKATVASPLLHSSTTDPCLDKQYILELFRNCIKLASENKINQKNTWELNLIDHLFEIVKVDEEDDVETNFQKASCTLEAGVKIYSMRVDSVHSEAYKVLGAINRVGLENEQGQYCEGFHFLRGEQEDGNSKKEKDRKWSPLSTLESSFEVLNVKKFDAAFSVDPLYHQTSAQFDEGGAKGLLLSNLGVYGGCWVFFDSLEVPGKFSSSLTRHDKTEAIDISFAKECTEQMVFNMTKLKEISPSLREIVNYFGEGCKRPDTFSSGSKQGDHVEEPYLNDMEFNADVFDNGGTWGSDHDDQASVADEVTYGVDHILPNLYEENVSVHFHDLDMDYTSPDVDGYLFLNLGFMSKQNAWAGPDHWKYQTTKGTAYVSKETLSPLLTKKSKAKKQATADIDFTKALDKDLAGVFAPLKNPKALLLPANREPCNTTLPEDCHYQPENLVKLFLLPNVTCLGRRGRKSFVTPSRQGDENGSFSFCDDDTDFGDQFDVCNGFSDVEGSNPLVSHPRQVNKIEVEYDRTSKQVDVQALKETLWESLIQEQGETISFKQALAAFPNDCSAAASLEDISPHLCFICLLHLANEHGLSIRGSEKLDDLSIHLQVTQ